MQGLKFKLNDRSKSCAITTINSAIVLLLATLAISVVVGLLGINSTLLHEIIRWAYLLAGFTALVSALVHIVGSLLHRRTIYLSTLFLGVASALFISSKF